MECLSCHLISDDVHCRRCGIFVGPIATKIAGWEDDFADKIDSIPGAKRVIHTPNHEIEFQPGERVTKEYAMPAERHEIGLPGEGHVDLNTGTVVGAYPPGMYRTNQGDKADYGEGRYNGMLQTHDVPSYDVLWDVGASPDFSTYHEPGAVGEKIPQHRLWPEGHENTYNALVSPKAPDAPPEWLSKTAIPDGEGILAPPSGRAILAEFMNSPIDMMQGQCRHCGGDLLEFPDGRRTCDHCGLPFEPEQEASGVPAELRPQIAGDPLTEGSIFSDGDDTQPYDTGAHGRDEYTHGHVLASAEIGIPCPQCGKRDTVSMGDQNRHDLMFCRDCQKVSVIPEEAGLFDVPDTGPQHPDAWMDNEPGTLVLPQGPPHTWNHSHVLAAAVIGPIDMMQGQCPRCGGDLLEFVDGHTRCDHCGNEAPPLHQNIDPVQHIPHAEMHAFDPSKKPNFLQRTFAITKTSDYEGWPNWEPDERLMDEFKHKDLTPFIAADPRLKLVEKKTSPGPTMANYSRTNNMEPYEVLWAQEPEIQLGAREAGLWGDLGAAALTAGGLALAVPTGGADLPEVAAGDAALLGGGEAASDAAASSGAGGLMSKAMSGAGGLAKAEGITSLVGQGAGMGEKALGLGGGGASQAGGGGEGYQSPLQQFTHVLAAFVESDSHVFPRIDNEGNYPCPKCHEFMLNKHDGQCDHCGYTIPYDGPSIDDVTPAIWDQSEQIPTWNPESDITT